MAQALPSSEVTLPRFNESDLKVSHDPQSLAVLLGDRETREQGIERIDSAETMRRAVYMTSKHAQSAFYTRSDVRLHPEIMPYEEEEMMHKRLWEKRSPAQKTPVLDMRYINRERGSLVFPRAALHKRLGAHLRCPVVGCSNVANAESTNKQHLFLCVTHEEELLNSITTSLTSSDAPNCVKEDRDRWIGLQKISTAHTAARRRSDPQSQPLSQSAAINAPSLPAPPSSAIPLAAVSLPPMEQSVMDEPLDTLGGYATELLPVIQSIIDSNPGDAARPYYKLLLQFRNYFYLCKLFLNPTYEWTVFLGEALLVCGFANLMPRDAVLRPRYVFPLDFVPFASAVLDLVLSRFGIFVQMDINAPAYVPPPPLGAPGPGAAGHAHRPRPPVPEPRPVMNAPVPDGYDFGYVENLTKATEIQMIATRSLLEFLVDEFRLQLTGAVSRVTYEMQEMLRQTNNQLQEVTAQLAEERAARQGMQDVLDLVFANTVKLVMPTGTAAPNINVHFSGQHIQANLA